MLGVRENPSNGDNMFQLSISLYQKDRVELNAPYPIVLRVDVTWVFEYLRKASV